MQLATSIRDKHIAEIEQIIKDSTSNPNYWLCYSGAEQIISKNKDFLGHIFIIAKELEKTGKKMSDEEIDSLFTNAFKKHQITQILLKTGIDIFYDPPIFAKQKGKWEAASILFYLSIKK